MRKQQVSHYYKRVLNNESGVVLVTTLLIMVVLAIMGTAAMTIRNTEQSITLNSEVFQHNFYAVEAVALEGAAAIENTSDTTLWNVSAVPTAPALWLKLQEDPSVVDLSQSSQWPGTVTPNDTTLDAGIVDITPPGYADDGTASGDRIWYAAMDVGICGGDLTDPTKREKCYDVYGMYDVKSGAGKAYHGRKMLQVGYKKVIYEP